MMEAIQDMLEPLGAATRVLLEALSVLTVLYGLIAILRQGIPQLGHHQDPSKVTNASPEGHDRSACLTQDACVGSPGSGSGLSNMAPGRPNSPTHEPWWHRLPSRPSIQVRLDFGSWLALALEFQLAADIVATTTNPSESNLIQLAVIALIRTFLNVFLSREIEAERRLEEEATRQLAANPNPSHRDKP